jgi:hypothetical protein
VTFVRGVARGISLSKKEVSMSQMQGGRAKGGPLNNVRIDAPETWDGLIQISNLSNSKNYHDGHYAWRWYTENDHRYKTWVWRVGRKSEPTTDKRPVDRDTYLRKVHTKQLLEEWIAQHQ